MKSIHLPRILRFFCSYLESQPWVVTWHFNGFLQINQKRSDVRFDKNLLEVQNNPFKSIINLSKLPIELSLGRLYLVTLSSLNTIKISFNKKTKTMQKLTQKQEYFFFSNKRHFENKMAKSWLLNFQSFIEFEAKFRQIL